MSGFEYQPDRDGPGQTFLVYSDMHGFLGAERAYGSELGPDSVRDVAEKLNLIYDRQEPYSVIDLGDSCSEKNLGVLNEELAADTLHLFCGDEDPWVELLDRTGHKVSDHEALEGVKLHKDEKVWRVGDWSVGLGHFPQGNENGLTEFQVSWWGNETCDRFDVESGKNRPNNVHIAVYGHSHLPYTRTVYEEIWCSPGSVSQNYNADHSLLPDQTALTLHFGEKEMDAITWDLGEEEMFQHRRFVKDGEKINQEHVAGSEIGIERIHPDVLNRVGADISNTEKGPAALDD